jgi:hypothetical protein
MENMENMENMEGHGETTTNLPWRHGGHGEHGGTRRNNNNNKFTMDLARRSYQFQIVEVARTAAQARGTENIEKQQQI